MTPDPAAAFCTLELARRLEWCSAARSLNYTQAYQRLHPEAQTGILPFKGGGCAVFIKPGSPVGSACGLGLSGPVTAQDLAEVEAFYWERGERPRLALCPLADESLVALTAERGYTIHYFFNVLAWFIPPDFSPAPLPANMRITQAGANNRAAANNRAVADEADRWLQVVAEGFEESDQPSPEGFDILGPNFHAANSVPFLAWLDDQPAGGGGMYQSPAERAFELGGASTRLAFRRRGVQRALIEARLAEGLRRGCDLAMVLTEPGSDSQRNLQRYGFFLAYTKPLLVQNRPVIA